MSPNQTIGRGNAPNLVKFRETCFGLSAEAEGKQPCFQTGRAAAGGGDDREIGGLRL